jgi:hypothetical protein
MFLRKLAKTVGFVASVIFLISASVPTRARPSVTVLAFGLSGAQSVFESEANGAASIVAQRLKANQVVVRANTKRQADVSLDSIAAALQSAAERMDRRSDILVLILTSHGSRDGVVVEAHGREQILAPTALAHMLNRAGVQHRIVVISACYSGVFLHPLANDDTLVITAADADHSSFGCRDKINWTYFGDAFFNRALRWAGDLRQAFAEARKLIRVREARFGVVHSNPQIAGGKNIDGLLAPSNSERQNGACSD